MCMHTATSRVAAIAFGDVQMQVLFKSGCCLCMASIHVLIVFLHLRLMTSAIIMSILGP